MTTQEIITAVNAYADAAKACGSTTTWLALVHRSSHGLDADAARQVRDAGKDALDEVQDWLSIEYRGNDVYVLQAPDGTHVLYFCECINGATYERLQAL
jgi:hypothetical protein